MLKFHVFLFFATFALTKGFANFMTKNYCDIPISEGTVMMGKEVEKSNARRIRAFRGEEEVMNGGTFFASDSIDFKLDPPTLQLVVEVRGGAKFVNGRCYGAVRSNTNGATIRTSEVMNNEVENIEVVAAWANSFDDGVKLTNTVFSLHRYQPTSSERTVSDDPNAL